MARAAEGRARSFGRKSERRDWSAGSCESAKVVFVVSGFCDVVPTPRALAEGVSPRNANFGGVLVGPLVSVSVETRGVDADERRDFN